MMLSAFKQRIEVISAKYPNVRLKQEKAVTKREIQALLIMRNSNFLKFAAKYGYLARTVTQVVDRWAGKKELPQGRLSFRILVDLSREIDQEITPGLFSQAV